MIWTEALGLEALRREAQGLAAQLEFSDDQCCEAFAVRCFASLYVALHLHRQNETPENRNM